MSNVSIRKLQYDAVTMLQENRNAILLHVCNNKSVMGSGIAWQIRSRIPHAYLAYVNVQQTLGSVPISIKQPYVANMIAQDGYYGYAGRYEKKCYLSYQALELCLSKVATFVEKKGLKKVIIPYRMGSDRAGGDWDMVLHLVIKYFENLDVEIVVCYLTEHRDTEYEKSVFK